MGVILPALTKLVDTELGLWDDIPGSVCSTHAFFDSVVPGPDSQTCIDVNNQMNDKYK